MRSSSETFDVARERDGSAVTVSVNRIGERPGRNLTLIGAQHGDEQYLVRILYEIAKAAEKWDFDGTLNIISVANPPAFLHGTRNAFTSSDHPDMNRIWGTEGPWLTHAIMEILAKEVIDKSDAVLDYHGGLLACSSNRISYAPDYPNQEISEQSRRMVVTYGPAAVQRIKMTNFPGPNSLTGYCGVKLEIPVAMVNPIGFGYQRDFEIQEFENHIRGVRNVMIGMNMLDGKVERPEKYLAVSGLKGIKSLDGGLIVPAQEPDTFMRFVEANEVVAEVVCPSTFAVLGQMTAPVAGWLMTIGRSVIMERGRWGYSVAPESDATWHEYSQENQKIIDSGVYEIA